ncbi:MAG TPA: enoyl-CoA hydratase [Pirellulales bacterium]|jgi:enoyl-CoA hydratase/carnithine racemase|nr:enoyl-CoA hydratase [Pirellulales bacterium]
MPNAQIAAAAPLLVENDQGVVRLTLNRPHRRNALSEELLSEMRSVLAQVAADERARVVVIAGNGPVFCAGHDLGEMVDRSEGEYQEIFGRCSAFMLQIRRLPQPVIARVHGLATAAGCQLVAACDLAVAADTARFATPGVKIGLFCTTPMVPIARAIPTKPALEMALTGREISAERARELGLVNRVVPAGQLDAAVREICDAILAASPQVIRLGKQAFYEHLALAEPEAYQRATSVMTRNASCRDAQEGMTAFLEKRAPVWCGE